MGHWAFSVGLERGPEDVAFGGGEGGDRHLDLPQDILLFRHREKHMVAFIQHWAAHTEVNTSFSVTVKHTSSH